MPPSLIRAFFPTADTDNEDNAGPKRIMVRRNVINDASRLKGLNTANNFKTGDFVCVIPEAAWYLKKKITFIVPEGTPLLVIDRPADKSDAPDSSIFFILIDGEGDVLSASLPAWALQHFEPAVAQTQHDDAVAAANRAASDPNGNDPFHAIDQAVGLLRTAMPENPSGEWLNALAAIETLHTTLIENRLAPSSGQSQPDTGGDGA